MTSLYRVFSETLEPYAAFNGPKINPKSQVVFESTLINDKIRRNLVNHSRHFCTENELTRKNIKNKFLRIESKP